VRFLRKNGGEQTSRRRGSGTSQKKENRSRKKIRQSVPVKGHPITWSEVYRGGKRTEIKTVV